MMEDFNEGKDLGPLQRLMGPFSVLKILDFFITFREYDYSISEISETTEIHRRSVSRILPVLEYYEVISNLRKIDRSQMYRLNKEANITQMLCKLSGAVADHDIDAIMSAETRLSLSPELNIKDINVPE